MIDLDRLRRYVDRLSLSELARLVGAEERGGIYAIPDEPGEGFRPSWFTAYFRCARGLKLKAYLGYELADAPALRALAYGVLAHRAYGAVMEASGYAAEVELEGEGYSGVADLLGPDGRPVELKSGNGESLGHRLQLMVYCLLAGAKEGWLVYPFKAVKVRLDEGFLASYRRRVEKVLEGPWPPRPPDASKCGTCPFRPVCKGFPNYRGSWDDYLNEIGELPKGEGCLSCPHRRACRAFRARHGRYPCESEQEVLAL